VLPRAWRSPSRWCSPWSFSAAAAIRRLAPELALAVCWVAAIMQMASGLPPLPANVVIFGVLYTTAAYGARRTFWLRTRLIVGRRGRDRRLHRRGAAPA
jgi:hypothetical protein